MADPFLGLRAPVDELRRGQWVLGDQVARVEGCWNWKIHSTALQFDLGGAGGASLEHTSPNAVRCRRGVGILENNAARQCFPTREEEPTPAVHRPA